MANKHKPIHHGIDYRALGLLVLIGVGLYVVLPQVGSFRASTAVLRAAAPAYVGLALSASLLAPIMGGVCYRFLALKRLPLSELIGIQLSGLLVNRLIPAGIGGIGLNVWYLQKRRHSTAESLAVVGLNNSLGFISHMLLLVIILLVSGDSRYDVPHGRSITPQVLGVGAGLLLVLTSLGLVIFRRRLIRFGAQLLVAWRRLASHAVQRPGSMLAAYVSASLLTLANSLCFYACLIALDVHLAFSTVFVIYTFGVFVGTATPTPGGIGGVEAALYVGLIGQSVTNTTALAIALLYRLVSYWFGLALGVPIFVYMRKRLA